MYRSTNVGVGGKEGVTHVAPPPNLVPQLMGESTPFIEFMLEVILESIKGSVESLVNTEDKILHYLKQNPKEMTI